MKKKEPKLLGEIHPRHLEKKPDLELAGVKKERPTRIRTDDGPPLARLPGSIAHHLARGKAPEISTKRAPGLGKLGLSGERILELNERERSNKRRGAELHLEDIRKQRRGIQPGESLDDYLARRRAERKAGMR